MSNNGEIQHSLLYESERLRTFEGWPEDSHIIPAELALFGFVYTQDRDVVKCIYCRVFIQSWEQDDDVLSEHFRWSGRCPLIINHRRTGNIPINAEQLNLRINIFHQNMPSLFSSNSVTTRVERPYGRTRSSTRDNEFFISIMESAYLDRQIYATPQSIPTGIDETSHSNFREDTTSESLTPLINVEEIQPEQIILRPITPIATTQRLLNQTNRVATIFEDDDDQVRVFSPHPVNLNEPMHYYFDQSLIDKHEKMDELKGRLIFEVEDEKDDDDSVESNELNNKCSICMIRPYCIVILPCRHLTTCARCTFGVEKCPTCRCDMDDYIKAYIG